MRPGEVALEAGMIVTDGMYAPPPPSLTEIPSYVLMDLMIWWAQSLPSLSVGRWLYIDHLMYNNIFRTISVSR